MKRAPRELSSLLSKKADLKIQMTTIKSIQLEFVKHSKLSRSMIKIDKEIEVLSGT